MNRSHSTPHRCHADTAHSRRRRRKRRAEHALYCHGGHRRGRPSGGGRGGRGSSGGHGGRRARRGDVRTAILLLLQEQALNGYQLMQEIETRSEGAWRPSPGSTYPALSLLEDEDLIVQQNVDGKKCFALTEAGNAEAQRLQEANPTPPWTPTNFHPAASLDARSLLKDMTHPLRQILRSGTPAQVASAQKVLSEAQRALYAILAEPQDS